MQHLYNSVSNTLLHVCAGRLKTRKQFIYFLSYHIALSLAPLGHHNLRLFFFSILLFLLKVQICSEDVVIFYSLFAMSWRFSGHRPFEAILQVYVFCGHKRYILLLFENDLKHDILFTSVLLTIFQKLYNFNFKYFKMRILK